MRNLVAVAALATLCACGQAEQADPAPEAQTETSAADVPDGGPVEGTFTVANEDGSTTTWTNNADGTYVATMADGSEAAGTFTMAGREYCYDPAGDGEGLEEVCLAFADAAEDGSWVSTRPDGTQATVSRVADAQDGGNTAAAQ